MGILNGFQTGGEPNGNPSYVFGVQSMCHANYFFLNVFLLKLINSSLTV